MADAGIADFAELPLAQVPFADLTPAAAARDGHFGGPALQEDIDYRRLKVFVRNRPLSWRLRHLFKRAGKVLPKGLMLYRDWDVWMIAHAISVADRGAFATVFNTERDAVGYEARFESGLAATVGMMPEPAVVKYVGGSFVVAANVGLNGSIATPFAGRRCRGCSRSPGCRRCQATFFLQHGIRGPADL